MPFDHEKLDAYQLAIGFIGVANDVAIAFPRGRGYLADQLQRAALSIALNIAEGCGKFSPAEKAMFFLRARGSAMECAATMDAATRLAILDDQSAASHKAILERIVQMLTKLARWTINPK